MESRELRYLVYKITNNVNNKIYFGITQQKLKKRWQQHKCNSSKKSYHLYNAMNKYGVNNFNIEIVFRASSREEMFSKEKELIKDYKSNNRIFGYNKSKGGESSRFGCKLTDKQKLTISNYQKERIRKPHSKSTKKRMSEVAKGRDMSAAIKASIESRKGKPANNTKPVVLNGTKTFNSLTEASKETGVSVTSISNNLKGTSKKTRVGIWTYKKKI